MASWAQFSYVISKNLDDASDRKRLTIQEWYAGTDTIRNYFAIVAIFDIFLDYVCNTPIQHKV